MALKLKLKAGEKVVVNGAVIENGDRATTITVKNMANVLRETDVMQQDEADTPVKRVYYLAQLMLLDGESPEKYQDQFEALVADLEAVFINPEVRELLTATRVAATEQNYYRCMATLRKIMKYEAVLLASTKLQAGDGAAGEET